MRMRPRAPLPSCQETHEAGELNLTRPTKETTRQDPHPTGDATESNSNRRASVGSALPSTVRIGRYELHDVLGYGGQGVV